MMQMTYRSRAALATMLTLTIGVAFSFFNHQSLARTAKEDIATHSLVGSYLAGRFARGDNDPAQAAAFYRSALARDPNNVVLLEQTFLMEATGGNWSDALGHAKRLVKSKPNHRTARMVLGISNFKSRRYSEAREHFKKGGTGPIGELTSAIAQAWVRVAEGKTKLADKALNVSRQADWAEFYLRYHRALIADVTKRPRKASKAYSRVYQQDSRTLRTVLAYARHAASTGNSKLARSLLKKSIRGDADQGHPLAKDLLQKLDARDKISLIVKNPTEGMSEVFYGLGEALAGEGGVGIGLLYLQMALYLEPEQPFALAALANAYESTNRYQEAIETYGRIPRGTPLQLSIDIRKAYNYNSLDRVDEAEKVLLTLAEKHKGDTRPLDALGNIMRSRKRYKEAITYYDNVLALVKTPKRGDWTYFYSRGTCHERLKQWDKAEKDLLKALELYPDQPLALNYLGYSWIDQGINLKKGLKLIEKAVRLKPEDGYIVDSLGWAHFKLGNYDKAVKNLERAVELRPEDPILNDHLGDALWQVGRHREARFQWEQALTLKPEPDVLLTIKKKLANGLSKEKETKVLKRTDASGAMAN
ncbi:MAG: tetratricopeptide repeat protein [Hyphomicrobiaceae bacterium]